MAKWITIEINYNNGVLLEFPEYISVECGSVIPVGESVVRDYNTNDCIVAEKVFLFRINSNTYGTKQYNNTFEFQQFLISQCTKNCIVPCVLSYNYCDLLYNGCTLSYGTKTITGCGCQ